MAHREIRTIPGYLLDLVTKSQRHHTGTVRVNRAWFTVVTPRSAARIPVTPQRAAAHRPASQRPRRTGHHHRVRVPDSGTSAYNRALSLRQAEAVRDQLIFLGLPSGQVTTLRGPAPPTIPAAPVSCMASSTRPCAPSCAAW